MTNNEPNVGSPNISPDSNEYSNFRTWILDLALGDEKAISQIHHPERPMLEAPIEGIHILGILDPSIMGDLNETTAVI